ncbi:DUF998 domain-containing protein [Streptomyces sp. NPDC005146]
MNRIVRSGAAARAGAALFLLAPLVSWVAEIITAAAWQDPPYSPLYNWVSHLGLTHAQTVFGQVGNSPLGVVMDAGWVIYGVLLIVGAFLVFDPSYSRSSPVSASRSSVSSRGRARTWRTV